MIKYLLILAILCSCNNGPEENALPTQYDTIHINNLKPGSVIDLLNKGKDTAYPIIVVPANQY